MSWRAESTSGNQAHSRGERQVKYSAVCSWLRYQKQSAFAEDEKEYLKLAIAFAFLVNFPR